LVLIKPDAVAKDIWFRIIQIYLRSGLVIRKARILRLDKKSAREFYREHKRRLYKGQSYFGKLVRHAISGETIALILSGEDAIRRVRELNGATNPVEAKAGTIRRRFGDPNHIERNSVHGSDSVESARREEVLIFGRDRS
jgi:nucleoside-diphosphate kinase